MVRSLPRRLGALARAHRRATAVAAIAGGVTLAFGAGALAMRADAPEKVEVETVGKSKPSVSTTKATTTVAPTTTATTAAPPTTAAPVTEPVPSTDPPPPPPPPVPTYTFEAPGAGTMTVEYEHGVLTVVATHAFDGWAAEVHTGSGTEYVKTIFRQGNVVKWVKAWAKDGQVVPETGEWTECDTTAPPSTATYENPGVGAITVTWNGQAFTLDAVTPAAGWAAVSQEVTGDFVKVLFEPASESTALTGDGGSQKWIKVKIHDCQIVHVIG